MQINKLKWGRVATEMPSMLYASFVLITAALFLVFAGCAHIDAAHKSRERTSFEREFVKRAIQLPAGEQRESVAPMQISWRDMETEQKRRWVLIVHGNPGAGFEFELVVEALGHEYRVVLFDRPGHGHSPRGRQSDASVQIAIIAALIRDLSVNGEGILVAHSSGAPLALLAYQRDPDVAKYVAAMVLLAPVAYPDATLFNPASEMYASKNPLEGWFVRNGGVFAAEAEAKHELASAFGARELPDQTSSSGKIALRAGRLYSRASQICAAAEDERSICEEARTLWPARIEAPIVVLVGDRDRIVAPSSHGRALVREPGVRGIGLCLPKVGHMLHLEAPATVADAVRLADLWADNAWTSTSPEIDRALREVGRLAEHERF